MTWKVIPQFPKYELNEQGEVRNIETQILKKLQTNVKYPRYVLYTGSNQHRTITRTKLLQDVFDVEKKLQKRKNKVEYVAKNCETCAWQFSGKCSVKNPGTVTSVENDDKCNKWERIRQSEEEIEFSEENYENSFTSQFDGVSMNWEGYALSI
jgi:hypothetical protein